MENVGSWSRLRHRRHFFETTLSFNFKSKLSENTKVLHAVCTEWSDGNINVLLKIYFMLNVSKLEE